MSLRNRDSQATGTHPSEEKGQDFFAQFITLPPRSFQERIDDYRRRYKDFNGNIVGHSAIEVLVSLGMSREKFVTVNVGPKIAGDDYNLFDQLSERLKPADYDKEYILFSLPTILQGVGHSVAVVICKSKKMIFWIDPLAATRVKYQVEGQLDRALCLPQFDGYKRLGPPKGYSVQQTDNWSCGVHSAMDIVGIILNEEIGFKVRSGLTHVVDYLKIDLSTGSGIQPRRDEDRDYYFALFCSAYDQYAREHGAKLNDPRLEVRKYKCLNFLVRDLTTVGLIPGRVKPIDLEPFKKAVADAAKAANEAKDIIDSDGNAQVVPFETFLPTLCKQDFSISFNPFLESPEFLQNLPQTMNDNVEQIAKGRLLALFKRFFYEPEQAHSAAAPEADLFQQRPSAQASHRSPTEATPLLSSEEPNEDDLFKMLRARSESNLATLEFKSIGEAGMVAYHEARKEAAALKRITNDADYAAKHASLLKSLRLATAVAGNPLIVGNIIALRNHANQEASGKSSLCKKFIGALMALVGVAIIGLSAFGIPFSGGSSLAGMVVGGSLLTGGGAALFYYGTQRKLAKSLSNLANEADTFRKSRGQL